MSESGRLVLLREVTNGVAEIVLNRPDKRNAMNEAAQQELLAALDACRQDARVLVLTGAGDRSFCAGIDLSELPDQQRRSAVGPARDTWLQVTEALRRHPAVVIAAVNGYALGGGLTLVNAADLAIAAEHATFGMPELGFGAFPRLAGPSTQRRIQRKRVAWLALTTERIDAPTALDWGLVNVVCPSDQLLAEARGLAARIASFDPIALAWTKRAIDEIEALDWPQSLNFGAYVRAMIASQRHQANA